MDYRRLIKQSAKYKKVSGYSHGMKLLGEMTEIPGVERKTLYSNPSGFDSIVVYSYDNQRYKVIVEPLYEYDELEPTKPPLEYEEGHEQLESEQD